MMESWSDAEVTRIAAQVAQLTQADAASDVPLRLFPTEGGDLVRVLDGVDAPLSPATLRAIERFTSAPAVDEKEPSPLVMATMGSNAKTSGTGTSHAESEAVLQPEADAPEGSLATGLSTDTAVDARKPVKRIEQLAEATPMATDMDTTMEEETTESLAAKQTSVSAFLGAQAPSRQVEPTSSVLDSGITSHHQPPATAAEQAATVTEESLYHGWPRALRERVRLCYVPPYRPHYHTSTPCIVYWLRYTHRIAHGNFALLAALTMARQRGLPVVAVLLSPASLLFPVRHAMSATDACMRETLTDMRRRLRALSIPLYGFSPLLARSLRSVPALSSAPVSSIDAGSGLFEIFSAFQPAVVITDAGYTLSSHRESECLVQHLATRANTRTWPLVAVDSTACLPFYASSYGVKRSLEHGDQRGNTYLRGDVFDAEYTRLMEINEPELDWTGGAHELNGEYQQQLNAVQSAVKRTLEVVQKRLALVDVTWEIVEASLTPPHSQPMPSYTESTALERLDHLVRFPDNSPAIQQELQGAGVTSLLPFVRHGALFAGTVLRRMTDAIATTPRPTDATSRKALAMLKVLRSRAVKHIARERDYALYLSLWAMERTTRQQQNPSFLAFHGLSCFQPHSSELDSFHSLLPTWATSTSSMRVVTEVPASPPARLNQARYDPSQLESGRTDDQYWNEIQLFLNSQGFLHPLVIVYWGYRILQWSLSPRAAIATIESLLDICSVGSIETPEASVIVWNVLFQLGTAHSNSNLKSEAPSSLSAAAFVRRIEAELGSQPTLKLKTAAVRQ